MPASTNAGEKMKRFYMDVELAKNLYPCNKQRIDRWRYKNPKTGKYVNFPNVMPVEEANALAEEMNRMVEHGFYEDRAIPPAERLDTYIHQYIAYRENLDPALKGKDSWKNRCYAFKQFAQEFECIRSLEFIAIMPWWDKLTYNQQKLRKAEFTKLFNYLMGQGLCPKLKSNPFAKDGISQLISKSKPKKKRAPCNQETFNNIHKRAGEQGYSCLQIAMDISRYTTLRVGDICSLRWDKNAIDGCLKVIVSKSQSQKGTARATRLSWNLEEHPLLKSYINRARELSLINRRCPFIISHTPKRRAWNDQKESLYQVTPERMSRMFDQCRGESKTTFHEIRGLSATLLRIAGHTNTEIQEVMSHESITTTKDYQNAEHLPYTPVSIKPLAS